MSTKMDQTILQKNMEKSKQALINLYALRDNPRGRAYYMAYCLQAVAMLEHISRFKG